MRGDTFGHGTGECPAGSDAQRRRYFFRVVIDGNDPEMLIAVGVFGQSDQRVVRPDCTLRQHAPGKGLVELNHGASPGRWKAPARPAR